jgi:hypothetical protein
LGREQQERRFRAVAATLAGSGGGLLELGGE